MKADSLSDLVREFVESDAIVNYDSSLCWDCGGLKTSKCEPTCLLERARRALCECQCHDSERVLVRGYFGVWFRGKGCHHCGLTESEFIAREQVKMLWSAAQGAAVLVAPRHSSSCALTYVYSFSDQCVVVACGNCDWQYSVEFSVPEWLQAKLSEWIRND